MKTIALKEKTFNLIKELKEKEKLSSFDKLITELVMHKEKIPKSMFGVLKGKARPFTRSERLEIIGNDERWR